MEKFYEKAHLNGLQVTVRIHIMNKKGASQESLNNVDAEISELIVNDLNRQNTHIHLIASENFASKAVM